ncbi:hypothetical protein BZZ01_04515 [Nostocales cyanobacterium HT-58-2]|nr:hypothetical protein BZZ01_04515 [Nostocales cyanobacterium HT-58-2]
MKGLTPKSLFNTSNCKNFFNKSLPCSAIALQSLKIRCLSSCTGSAAAPELTIILGLKIAVAFMVRFTSFQVHHDAENRTFEA